MEDDSGAGVVHLDELDISLLAGKNQSWGFWLYKVQDRRLGSDVIAHDGSMQDHFSNAVAKLRRKFHERASGLWRLVAEVDVLELGLETSRGQWRGGL